MPKILIISPPLILTGNNVPGVIKWIRQSWYEVFPERIFEYKFLDENLAKFYEDEEKTARMIQLFALIAILIGCLGIVWADILYDCPTGKGNWGKESPGCLSRKYHEHVYPRVRRDGYHWIYHCSSPGVVFCGQLATGFCLPDQYWACGIPGRNRRIHDDCFPDSRDINPGRLQPPTR